jgi:hypothetical protein
VAAGTRNAAACGAGTTVPSGSDSTCGIGTGCDASAFLDESAGHL